MRRYLLAALALAVAVALPCVPSAADDIVNWSGTDASNNRTPPNGFPEGMFPSQVDDGMRAVMGAVQRWFFGERRSVKQYGVVGDGSTDDTANMQAAVTAALAGNFALYVPPGTYKLTSGITGTIPAASSFHLEGAGQDISILQWTGASGGLTLNYTNEHCSSTISDLTFYANTDGAGTGLNLVQQNTNVPNEGGSAQTTLTNVTFRGGLGAGASSHYWTTAFSEQGVSNINMNSVIFLLGTVGVNGDAISLVGLSTATQSCCVYLNGVNVDGGHYGLIYGSWVQGVQIVNSSFTDQLNNIIETGTSKGTELSVSNSQFGLNTGNSVEIDGLIGGTIFTGNTFDATASGMAGINVNSTTAGAMVVANNIFSGITNNVAYGVNLAATEAHSRDFIIGNEFLGLNKGINIGASASGVIVGPNAYGANGFNVVDAASDTVYSSSQVVTGSTSSVAVVGGGGNVFMSLGPSGTVAEGSATLFTGVQQTINITACFANNAPGTGQTDTLTFRQNNVSTGLTCTISGTSNAGTVAGSPIALGATDVWDVLVQPSAGAASSAVRWTGTITPAP